MFIVEVYENYGAKDHKAPPDRRLMTFFKFRDDQVQIWVNDLSRFFPNAADFDRWSFFVRFQGSRSTSFTRRAAPSPRYVT